MRIIKILQDVVREVDRDEAGQAIGDLDKRAAKITYLWQERIKAEFPLVRSEQKVSKLNKQCLDCVDPVQRMAIELKVSGKNTHHEFFKDLFKVVMYNTNFPEHRLNTFLFITDEKGVTAIRRRIDPPTLREIKDKLGIEILIEPY